MAIEKRQLLDWVERIGREFSPERIILFGSCAYGKPTEDPGVDLLVVMAHEGRDSDQALKLVQQVQPRIPVDLLVRTPHVLQNGLPGRIFS